MASIITKFLATAASAGVVNLLKATGLSGEHKERDPSELFEGVDDVKAVASDGGAVAGWGWRNPKGVCTVLLAHGFMDSSRHHGIVDLARKLADGLSASVVSADLRSHGNSGCLPPSMGEAESWDLSAALTWAEGRGYPKPFLLYGVSLGGMAARLCAVDDKRVAAVYTRSAPACARAAVANHHKMCGFDFLPVAASVFEQGAELAQDAYGWGILDRGDVRNRPPNPGHRPLVMSVMGDRDPYGYGDALSAWNHLYPDSGDRAEARPPRGGNSLKWFVTVRGAGHGWDGSEYPDMMGDMMAFYKKALDRGPALARSRKPRGR